jgi:hypothetical protein
MGFSVLKTGQSWTNQIGHSTFKLRGKPSIKTRAKTEENLLLEQSKSCIAGVRTQVEAGPEALMLYHRHIQLKPVAELQLETRWPQGSWGTNSQTTEQGAIWE